MGELRSDHDGDAYGSSDAIGMASEGAPGYVTLFFGIEIEDAGSFGLSWRYPVL
jgi:hypothetical protein